MASRGGRGGGGMRGGPMGGGMRGGPGKPTYMPDLLNVSNVHANCYLLIYVVLSVSYITANLYCICLKEHETCASTDAVQICGSIWNAQYVVQVNHIFIFFPKKVVCFFNSPTPRTIVCCKVYTPYH